MAPISGGKLQQIDLKNKQQDNIPVMGSEKNGNLLDSCNYLDDNRDSYQRGYGYDRDDDRYDDGTGMVMMMVIETATTKMTMTTMTEMIDNPVATQKFENS